MRLVPVQDVVDDLLIRQPHEVIALCAGLREHFQTVVHIDLPGHASAAKHGHRSLNRGDLVVEAAVVLHMDHQRVFGDSRLCIRGA